MNRLYHPAAFDSIAVVAAAAAGCLAQVTGWLGHGKKHFSSNIPPSSICYEAPTSTTLTNCLNNFYIQDTHTHYIHTIWQAYKVNIEVETWTV